MSDTVVATVGLKGRVVIPQAIRQRHAWGQGTQLVFVETATGVEIRDRAGALAQLRQRLAQEPSLADSLIADRRGEVAGEAGRA